MERQPSFARVIGGDAEQIKEFEEKAHTQVQLSGYEEFGDDLLMPTPEEQELIEMAVKYVNEIAAYYGGANYVEANRVFLVTKGGIEKKYEGIEGGVSKRLGQVIAVEPKPSPILLAMVIVHEACHQAAYHSVQIIDDGTDLPYRQGISMIERGGGAKYFKLAEEAIVTKLAKKFYDDVLSHDPRFSDEIFRTRKIKSWLMHYIAERKFSAIPESTLRLINDIIVFPNNEEVYNLIFHSTEPDSYKFGVLEGRYFQDIDDGSIVLERMKERITFEETLALIVQKSNGVITEHELFDDFASAHFTGNYLPLAKKVERIMGVGYFREIANILGVVPDTEDVK